MTTKPGGIADSPHERLWEQRIVCLDAELTATSASRVCAQLLALSVEDGSRDIAPHVNCSGGSVDAGLAINDTMRYPGTDIATLAVGDAAIGQFLVSAGTPGKRGARPESPIKLHRVLDDLAVFATDPAVQAEQMIHSKRVLLAETARHTGQSIERLGIDADRDHWCTPAEAMRYGLVDDLVVHQTV